MDANELRDTIAEKTSLTMEQAKSAAAAAVAWFQDNMPDDASDQLREFVASAGDWASQAATAGIDAAKGAGDAAADMLDKAKGASPAQDDSTDN